MQALNSKPPNRNASRRARNDPASNLAQEMKHSVEENTRISQNVQALLEKGRNRQLSSPERARSEESDSNADDRSFIV